MTTARGRIINVHAHGAIARLDDGTLAAVPAAEFASNRAAYVAGSVSRASVELTVERRGGHPIVALAREGAEELVGEVVGTHPNPSQGPRPSAVPLLRDAAFEAQMNNFLRSIQEDGAPDRPPAAERHFIRKKRRAAIFEARAKRT